MIACRRLAYRYPGGSLLRFDDIEVPQGGLLLLLGASGSGKSTWLALAAALLAPEEGDMVVAGQSLKHLRGAAGDAWRAQTIGFLPQRLHLSPALTVQSNLAMAQWAAGRPADAQRITETLATLGVERLAERKPAQLSGGQAQRVALARAVLLQPRVILADEPTASLDDDTASASLNLLRDTAANAGATLVIATHDTRVASHFEHQNGLQRLCIKDNML